MALAALAVARAALAVLLATIGPGEARDGHFIEGARGRAADCADHTAQLLAWRGPR